VEALPLFFGRLLRILSGLALLAWFMISPPSGVLWRGVLLFFGLSLVIGGIMAYPGYEISALPNLLLRRHMHCY
jgi:hypothetical protein